MTTVSTDDHDDKGRRYRVSGMIPADIGTDDVIEIPLVDEGETPDPEPGEITGTVMDDPSFVCAYVANWLATQGYARVGPTEHRLGEAARVFVTGPGGERLLITVDFADGRYTIVPTDA